MRTVKMCRQIGGYRNLEPWPAAGETIEVPDSEADDLVIAGYADYVDDESASEEDAGEDTSEDGDETPAEDSERPAPRAPVKKSPSKRPSRRS